MSKVFYNSNNSDNRSHSKDSEKPKNKIAAINEPTKNDVNISA